jgi:hydroxyacylglutathione hydrolase
LFNAGAGNCHNGGSPAAMYRTFADQLHVLPENTLLYPGHDYIENNLHFTLDREPGNQDAQQLLDTVSGQNLDQPFVSTLGREREVNAFFRLQSPAVIDRLRQAFPDLPEHPDARTVFLKLRELRNHW